MPEIYAAVSRPRTAFAALIDPVSRVCCPDPGLPFYPTHAYVVIRRGDWAWRFDAEIPRATWFPFDAADAGAHQLWRITDPAAAAAAEARARAVKHLVPYDPTEIAQAAATAVLKWAGLPDPGMFDLIRGAMVCTRLTASVLGWEIPDLFPVRIALEADRRAALGGTVRADLRGLS